MLILPLNHTNPNPTPHPARASAFDPNVNSDPNLNSKLELTPNLNPTPLAQVVSGPVLWTPDEDKLLHAIVHEFGSNWSLVCDVLASSTALQGIARNWRQCKDRFKEIQVRVWVLRWARIGDGMGLGLTIGLSVWGDCPVASFRAAVSCVLGQLTCVGPWTFVNTQARRIPLVRHGLSPCCVRRC